jgi:micrococcal nuclease
MATAEVVHVSDGDTVVVSIDGREERVRYVGLDAPEIAHPEDGTPAECWGDEARAANAELVDGETVALERDVSDRDRFGRLLRHVWVSDAGTWTLVGERLIRDGNAEARTYPPDTTRDAPFDDAELAARDASLGLWGSC